jgi:hypothetical protein
VGAERCGHTTELTKPQRDLLAALDLDPPKKIIELTSGL